MDGWMDGWMDGATTTSGSHMHIFIYLACNKKGYEKKIKVYFIRHAQQ